MRRSSSRGAEDAAPDNYAHDRLKAEQHRQRCRNALEGEREQHAEDHEE